MTAPSELMRTGAGSNAPVARSVRPRPATAPVWLVLHEPDDAAGPALAQALQAHAAPQGPSLDAGAAVEGGPEVLALSAWTLRLRAAWTLCVDGTGTHWRLTLGDGRVLDGSVVAGVVNRLGPVNPAAPDPETGYQAAEWSALMLAWLHGLQCPVVNRPRPANPYPRLHDAAWWHQQAARAGLPAGSAAGTGPLAPSNWLVVGQRVVPARSASTDTPPISTRIRQAMCRLTQQAGCDLMAVQGWVDPVGQWRFGGADLLPAADGFGRAGLAALAQALAPAANLARPQHDSQAQATRPSPVAARAGLVAVLGRATEGPCHLLLSALKRLGTPAVLLEQHQLPPPDPKGFNRLRDSNGQRADWDHMHGLYLRPADTRSLGLNAQRQAAAQAHTAAWSNCAEWAPWVVVNRLSAMLSNSSKPLQSQVLASLGFAIPPMLLTTHPAAVSAFEAEHGPLIFKSASGVRSIVRPLDAQARHRLDQVRHAPTLFQKRLSGTNVRVHVVGQAVFATEIDSGALDYRYAGRQGQTTELRATRLPLDLEGRCRQAAQRLGLHFAGLDLMLADDGQVYCFEVNPSPGYSWYEDATGQDISGALAALLSGRGD